MSEPTHNQHVGAMFRKAREIKGIDAEDVVGKLNQVFDQEYTWEDLELMESGMDTMTIDEMTVLASLYGMYLDINLTRTD